MKRLVEERISIDKDVCSGKPCIKGTRVQISDILLALAEGLSDREIMKSFRTIRKEDITATLAYAYCVTDGINLTLSGASGTKSTTVVDNSVIKREELEEKAKIAFAKSLEEQAQIQEEITEEKLARLKEEKKTKTKELPKAKAPEKEVPDLEIELEDYAPMKIFNTKDAYEQGLEMQVENYIFELRTDGQDWLLYSVAEDIEIEKDLKRNIKLSYKGKTGFFEGYLASDKIKKVFIQKEDQGTRTPGRVL